MIRKKFTTIGNSWGVVIPKALIDAMGINPAVDEIGITIDNNIIKIEKCDKKD